MRVKTIYILLLIATATVFIGCRARSVHDTGTRTTVSALAGEMRKHPYYADALARGVVFVYPRKGYPESWRYSFQLPSQFAQRMLAIEETELKRKPDGDSFEHHVWKMASLLKDGTILNQKTSQVDGFEFVVFTVRAPQGFAKEDNIETSSHHESDEVINLVKEVEFHSNRNRTLHPSADFMTISNTTQNLKCTEDPRLVCFTLR